MTADEHSDETKLCPYCAETIKAAAIVCRFCGRDLETHPRGISRQSSGMGEASEHQPWCGVHSGGECSCFVSVADRIEGKHKPEPVQASRAQIGVEEGVKLGCGMFIVLPLLLILGGVLLMSMCPALDPKGWHHCPYRSGPLGEPTKAPSGRPCSSRLSRSKNTCPRGRPSPAWQSRRVLSVLWTGRLCRRRERVPWYCRARGGDMRDIELSRDEATLPMERMRGISKRLSGKPRTRSSPCCLILAPT